jgi:hypothetical protein
MQSVRDFKVAAYSSMQMERACDIAAMLGIFPQM